MEINNQNLCDYCFKPVIPGTVCNNCHLTDENYRADADLLAPKANLGGKYIIGRTLGRGGFGVTYMAYSSDRREAVAIKEYFPNGIACRAKGEEKISIVSDDKRDLFHRGAKRFFEEAKTMSKFRDVENVVNVYEFFYANDTVYYSMEYLDGIDLKGYVEKCGGRIPEAEAYTIMKKVCNALVDLHSAGTLHRDISPDNVFICKNGDVKLIDFGAAKQIVGEYSQSLSVILKQGFAPAEQYQKGGNQGMWTDIYATGATIYYALTGKIPEDALARLEDPQIVFSPELNISPRFAHIINKCMCVQIKDRYQYAKEVLSRLNELNIPEVDLSHKGFVKNIYNGRGRTDIRPSNSQSILFDNKGGDNMQEPINYTGSDPQYGEQQWNQRPVGVPPEQPYRGQTQYGGPYAGQQPYMQSQYIPQPPVQPKKKDKAKIIRYIIIIAASLFIVAMMVTLIIELMKPDSARAYNYDEAIKMVNAVNNYAASMLHGFI